VTTDKDGKPASVGVVLSEKALTDLPGQDHGDHGGHDHSNSTVLEFPKQAELTPFRGMTLDWNPNGHDPHPIYSKPHFDFHFYMITEAARLTIPGLPPTEMDPELPAAQYLPTDYIPTPGRVPAMGVHWVDKTSPELNGGPFTQTFIFGSLRPQGELLRTDDYAGLSAFQTPGYLPGEAVRGRWAGRLLPHQLPH
jgi:hypothetical protein